jgi:hypothetical protein
LSEDGMVGCGLTGLAKNTHGLPTERDFRVTAQSKMALQALGVCVVYQTIHLDEMCHE